MKDNNKIFNEELTSYVFNPDRLNNICKLYDTTLIELIHNL